MLAINMQTVMPSKLVIEHGFMDTCKKYARPNKLMLRSYCKCYDERAISLVFCTFRAMIFFCFCFCSLQMPKSMNIQISPRQMQYSYSLGCYTFRALMQIQHKFTCSHLILFRLLFVMLSLWSCANKRIDYDCSIDCKSYAHTNECSYLFKFKL